MSPSSIVTVENLSVTYRSANGSIEALRDLSFDVKKGELFTIVGPSGCGKTTLLNAIAGLFKYRKDVTVNGSINIKDVKRVGYVFQKDALLPWRSVLDNVALGLEIMGFKNKDRRARGMELIQIMGLGGYENRYPHELSGGMRQRVTLARTLAYDPELILMDEPLGMLDAQTRSILQDEILRLHRRTGKTMILVTHDIAEAIVLGDRVLVMSSRPGRIISEHIIDLPKDRRALDSRLEPEFNRLYAKILEELKVAFKTA